MIKNCIFRLILHLYMCPDIISYITNNWLIGVIMGGLMVRMLLSSIHIHTVIEKFEEVIIMRLIQLPLLPLAIWIIHSMDQLSSLCTSMHIMERVRIYIPLCRLSGIRIACTTNKLRWMVVSN